MEPVFNRKNSTPTNEEYKGRAEYFFANYTGDKNSVFYKSVLEWYESLAKPQKTKPEYKFVE